MKTVSFQGDISSLALGDVLQNLATNRKTGTLTVFAEENRRFIQFQDGQIVSYGDTLGFSVAAWLADKGLLDAELREEAERRYKKAKKKSLGEILHDLGALDLDDYTHYLKELILETIYEVLSFREGTFEFHEGPVDETLTDRDSRKLGLTFAPASVMMEAARRMDDWQNIRAHIPSENEIYHVPQAERTRRIEQTEDEVLAAALDLMDGTRSVRQVIAQLPYSRFEACQRVAQLVAEKTVRLLKSAEIMQQERSDVDPKQEISCLKAILEREPNNRQILQRLADLHEQQGDRGESVTYNKLLAIAYSDDDELKQAESHLRKALRLNPRDIATWRKLWDVVRREGDRSKMLSFGTQYAAHFKRLGLVEVARDHLVEMAKLFPEHTKFRVDLADVNFSIGDRKACIQGLFDLARDLVNGERLEEAEKVFARILKYDRNNQKARQYHEKIRSGVMARKQAFRQRLVKRVAVIVGFTTILGFFAYDVHVRMLVLDITRPVISGRTTDREAFGNAWKALAKLGETHSISLAARLEIPVILEEMKAADRNHKRHQNERKKNAPKAPETAGSKAPSKTPDASRSAPGKKKPAGTSPPVAAPGYRVRGK